MSRHSSGRSRAQARGSAIVEAALCLALLGPLLFAGMKTVSAAAAVIRLEQAVTNAARYGAKVPEPDRIANVAVYGNPEGAGAPRIAGLRREHIRVEVLPDAVAPREVRVSVAGFAMPWPVDRVLNGSPSAKFPVTGR